MTTASSSWKLITEFLVCFIILPLLYWLDWIPVHKIIPLLALFIYCSVVLLKHKRINKSSFTWSAEWKGVLVRFLMLGGLIILFIYVYRDHAVLADLSNRKLIYMLIMYPFFSAFPQEVIYREFFYYRYQSFFRNKYLMLLANVLLFAFAHLYFRNWVVVAFTLIGGLIFSLTYLKTKSLLMVTVEHTLYGLLILSTGLSEYFYKAF